MIKTITVAEFCEFVNGNSDVKGMMRLDRIRAGSKLDQVSRGLKHDGITITNSIAIAIARLAMFFGLDHTSSGETLSRLVYEIAQGWALKSDGVTQCSWQAKARCFMHTITRTSEIPVSFPEQSKIYHA